MLRTTVLDDGGSPRMTGNGGQNGGQPWDDHSAITSGLTSSITTGIVSSMTDTDKVRENRLRRAAQRQSLMLTKSRRRDPRATDFGKYKLIDKSSGWGPQSFIGGYEMSLDDVEAALNE